MYSNCCSFAFGLLNCVQDMLITKVSQNVGRERSSHVKSEGFCSSLSHRRPVLCFCLANGLLSMCTSRKYELVMGECLCGRRTLPQTAAATEKPHKISNSNNEPTRANTTTTVES